MNNIKRGIEIREKEGGRQAKALISSHTSKIRLHSVTFYVQEVLIKSFLPKRPLVFAFQYYKHQRGSLETQLTKPVPLDKEQRGKCRLFVIILV